MAPERKRPTRSQLYQHLLVEKAFSHEMLETFPNEDSIYKKLNPFDYDERILELEDQLKERFWEIINEYLTDRQLEIVNLLKSGATQQECARKMGVNQCLERNTLISFNKENNQSSLYTVPIGELFEMWNINSKIVSSMHIKCFNFSTNNMFNTNISAVASGGFREIIEITTDRGNIIKSSADHKFFTRYGWKRLEDVIKNKLSIMIVNDLNIIYDNINNFNIIGESETFDIEVNNNFHNFVANNVIVSNSSITKSLNGNVDYSKENGKASYGGIVKKLGRIVEKDTIIKQIKGKISDIRNSSWI